MVSCGGYHTLVKTEDKKLFTFGAGEFGECGHGDQKSKMVPTELSIMKPTLKKVPGQEFNPDLDLALISDISAGTKHSVVLISSGHLFTFGFGDSGQLGLKNTDNQKKPTLVADFGDVGISKISAGNSHTMV